MAKTDRWVTLEKILREHKHKVGAEIGCFKGETTRYILETLDIEMLYCVDPWIKYPEYIKTILEKNARLDFEKDVYQVFLENTDPFKDRIKVLRKSSSEAVKEIENRSLDFVFIDANHSYEYVKEDILLWIPKIKNGGLLSGHDYGIRRFGVTKAVNELIGKDKIKVDNTIWHLKKSKKILK